MFIWQAKAFKCTGAVVQTKDERTGLSKFYS